MQCAWLESHSHVNSQPKWNKSFVFSPENTGALRPCSQDNKTICRAVPKRCLNRHIFETGLRSEKVKNYFGLLVNWKYHF